MSQKYRIAQGCTILMHNGTTSVPARAGTVVTSSDFRSQKSFQSHVKTGHLIPINRDEGDVADRGYTDASSPGVDIGKPLPAAENTEIETHGRSTERTKHAVSRWVLDPAGLKDLSVEKLNAMIAERGSEEVYETVEEAVAYLSQDYVAARVAQS